ncbi:MAG: hypothetical protein QOE84_1239 [Actinomycetota bacterium]|nr:hypothetical protein [Actinomycetota bacterium]
MGGVEALVFGVLVFVAGVLVVSNAWGVLDAKLAASSAAREAARAYVEAPSVDAAFVAARRAAGDAMAGHGRSPARTTVRQLGGTFVRCSRVTFEVSYPVPLLRVPFLGSAGAGFTARARHSEVVDPYRSGLAGTAHCA